MKTLSVSALAKYLDHVGDWNIPLEQYCETAVKYGVRCCAVNIEEVKFCKDYLKGTDILVSGAVAFPGGSGTIQGKLADVGYAMENGADEVDYVINTHNVKNHDWDKVEEEITAIAELCSKNGVADKVIFENCLYNPEEKTKLCEIAVKAGPAFIKTSTGKSFGGATPEDVRLMKKIAGEKCKIKAAGGIRNYYTALAMIEAGADRLGTSSAVKILEGYAAYLESMQK